MEYGYIVFVFMIVVMMLGHSSGELSCNLSVSPVSCTASSDEDLLSLPTNVSDLYVGLIASNTVRLADGVFPPLPLLTTLTLDLQYINDVEDGCFRHLPQLNTLKFVNSDIYRPHHDKTMYTGSLDGLSELTWFEAVDTGLHIIQENVLDPVPNLLYLDLGNNHIQYLPPNIFHNCSQLTMLGLAKNRLTSVSTQLFSGLSSVLSMDLSSNSLVSIGPETFQSMTKLNELDLRKNQITALDDRCFTGLASLVKLKLSENQLQMIGSLTFAGLNNIESLDLSENSITSIEDGSFYALDKLQYLELYKNKLSEIRSGTFGGLRSLAYLDLYDNDITMIAGEAFKNALDLQGLHIHSNNLMQIHPAAFSQLYNLIVLTLHDNSLQWLVEGTFDDLHSLNLLDISLNPWDCVCDLSWLHLWLNPRLTSSILQLSQWMDTTCSTPADQASTVLTTYLMNSYYTCNPTTLAPTTTMAATTTQVTSTEGASTEITTIGGTTIEAMTTEGATTEAPIIRATTAADTETTTNITGFIKNGNDDVLSSSVKAGIIAGCILVALLLVAVTMLGVYCRHKKHAFWKPEQPPKPTDAETVAAEKRQKILRNAKQKHDSFYQDPETGDIHKLIIEPSERKKIRESLQEADFNLDKIIIDGDANANKLNNVPNNKKKQNGINNVTDDDKMAKITVISETDDNKISDDPEYTAQVLSRSRQSLTSTSDSVFESGPPTDEAKLVSELPGSLPTENKGLENFAFEESLSEKSYNADQAAMSQANSMEMAELVKSAPQLPIVTDKDNDYDSPFDQQGAASDTEVEYSPVVDTSDIMAEVDKAMRRHSSIYEDSNLTSYEVDSDPETRPQNDMSNNGDVEGCNSDTQRTLPNDLHSVGDSHSIVSDDIDSEEKVPQDASSNSTNDHQSDIEDDKDLETKMAQDVYSNSTSDSHRTSQLSSETDKGTDYRDMLAEYSSSSTDDFPTTDDLALTRSMSHVEV